MNIHFLQSDHGLFLIKKASYGHNLISLTYILGIYSRRHNSLGSFVCNPDEDPNLTQFRNDLVKIADFLIKAYF